MDTLYQTLYDLKENESLIVQKIDLDFKMKQRFLDMGMIQGSKVTCVFVSPFNDPKAYLIKGTVLAIRKEEALKIKGRKIDDAKSRNTSFSW